MNKIIPLAAMTLLASAWITLAPAREKWPAQTEESKKQQEATRVREEEIWKKIQPEIEAWAKKGKPYIPSAAKPSDLPQAEILAFPGAEGGGAHSFGGRGGRVYVVTSLEDSGPGTLREACEAAGPRIVVFNVAGIIKLKDRIRVRAPYLTIAGQKAPGDGICVAGNSLEIDTHDVVIRYMRFRRGEMDVYDRQDSLGGNPVGNVIVDHCSASWGFDENLSMYRHMYNPGDGTKELKLPTVNITIQWCISSEALDTFNHAFGGTWGGRNCSFHHNLFASNTGRNPSIGMDREFNFMNNVLFNWQHRSVDGSDHTLLGNIINNYYKPGPATPNNSLHYRVIKPESMRGKNVPLTFGKLYVDGNIVEGNEKVSKDNWAGGVQLADENELKLPEGKSVEDLIREIRVSQPFPMAEVKIQSAADAYTAVLQQAGATLPHRDPVDERIIREVSTGKVTYVEGKGIITDPKQVGGYPKYEGKPLVDSDSDGMPDAWETQHKLNPNDAADASQPAADGYTNIERYLNDLPAEDPEAKYTQAIDKRASDIVEVLAINDSAKADRVHKTIVDQYRALRDWHDANDAKLKDKSTDAAAKAEIEKSRVALHDDFLAALATDLSPEQVETVKDKMVYGKVKVTYDAYVAMAGTLNDEQKAKILDLLKQAREEAMDGGSADEKSAVFKKYKGKINNYLASQGIDMKKAEKAFFDKAKANTAAATQAAGKQ